MLRLPASDASGGNWFQRYRCGEILDVGGYTFRTYQVWLVVRHPGNAHLTLYVEPLS